MFDNLTFLRVERELIKTLSARVFLLGAEDYNDYFFLLTRYHVEFRFTFTRRT